MIGRFVFATIFAASVLSCQAQELTGNQRAEASETSSFSEREGSYWRSIAFGQANRDAEPAIDDVPLYIDRYRQAVVYDPIIAVFSIKAERVGTSTNSLVLAGDVSLSWHRQGAERMLRGLGFEVMSNLIRVLPDAASVGALPYAMASTASATMRRFPAMDAEQVNSVVQGWPMRVLRAAELDDLRTSASSRRRGGDQARETYTGGWLLAQSSDGYVGFVRDDQVSRTATYRLPDAILAEPLVAADSSTTVPGGAGLLRGEKKNGRNKNGFAIPAGQTWREIAPPASMVLDATPQITSDMVLSAAKPLMNTGYLWGGATEQGIDCSGLTGLIYKLLGVYLPRDARPQSVVGQIVAWGPDVEREGRAGDLVYFADESGRISHIGMCLGDGKLIHSSGGAGVHVCDYSEKSHSRPNGMLERVVFARRILRGGNR